MPGGVQLIATTGLDEVIAFSTCLDHGYVVYLPQFRDRQLFLEGWLKFWASKKPDWLTRYEYRIKRECENMLKTINIMEKLLYGNDRELRDAAIEAFKVLGFDARPEGGGARADINLSYESFVGTVEVKGLKSHADRDDMRALLDYCDASSGQQSGLRGLFVVNHYRDLEPLNKGSPYTDGSLELANRKGFCLLTSDDLYFAVERVLEKRELQELVRQKIIQGKGLVRLGEALSSGLGEERSSSTTPDCPSGA